MEPTNQGEPPTLSQVIQIDEGKIQEHLGEVVRSTVEETLNAMLDAEADRPFLDMDEGRKRVVPIVCPSEKVCEVKLENRLLSCIGRDSHWNRWKQVWASSESRRSARMRGKIA